METAPLSLSSCDLCTPLVSGVFLRQPILGNVEDLKDLKPSGADAMNGILLQ